MQLFKHHIAIHVITYVVLLSLVVLISVYIVASCDASHASRPERFGCLNLCHGQRLMPVGVKPSTL